MKRYNNEYMKFVENSGLFSPKFKNSATKIFDFTQDFSQEYPTLAKMGVDVLTKAGKYLYKNRRKIARVGKKLLKNTVDAISLPFSNFLFSRKNKRRKMSQEQQQEIKPVAENTESPAPASPVNILPTSTGSGGLRELDEYPASQDEIIEEEPIKDIEEPEPIKETLPNFQIVKLVQDDVAPSSPSLVPVKGNSKVYRCLKCKTFVSATKPHTAAECAARKNKEIKSTASTTKRRRKVDKELLKNFRILEKRDAAAAAKGAILSKKAQSLIKKYNKKSKKSSPVIPKQIMSFLDSISKKF